MTPLLQRVEGDAAVLLRTQGKVPRLQHSVKGSDPYGVLSLEASRKPERVEMVERMKVVARGTMHARLKDAIPWARNCRVWVHLTALRKQVGLSATSRSQTQNLRLTAGCQTLELVNFQ